MQETAILASLRRRLTYANVMATIALFIALGGSSYAVATGSIASRQLKNNAVRTVDLKDNDIRTRDIRNGTLAGIDIKNDALTGADVRESTLQTVPSANTAHSADAADTAAHAARADSADRATNIAAAEGFHEVGAPGEPPFNPGCANNTANALFQSVGFYKDREGVVHLKGSYSCANPGAPAFHLPDDYRPANAKIETQAVVCDGDNCAASHTALVNVAGAGVGPAADGVVQASAATVILDGVTFRASE